MIKQNTLDENDFKNFRIWLQLDMGAVTWQGRFSKEFEQFWNILFSSGLSIDEICYRIRVITKLSKSGPLFSWFKWLEGKFLAFIFINKNINVYNLAKLSRLSINDLSLVLRNFFLSKFPHLDSYFSSTFQITNLLSPNTTICFEAICNQINISEDFLGSNSDEIMCSLEVTLYDEWFKILSTIENHFGENKKDENKLGEIFLNIFKIGRDLFILILVIMFIIFVTRQVIFGMKIDYRKE